MIKRFPGPIVTAVTLSGVVLITFLATAGRQNESRARAAVAENAKAARPDAAPAARGGGAQPAPYQDWVLPKLKEIRDRRLIDDPSGRC